MRTLPFLLLLLSTYCCLGQIRYKHENFHVGLGYSASSINFQQNGAGAIAVPIRYDWLKFGKSSFSLGSNLKIGTTDEYGVSFPILLIVAMILGSTGANPPDLSSPNNGNLLPNYSINFHGEAPLLLHYNFGLGTPGASGNPSVGFFIGGGINSVVTGVPLGGQNSSQLQQGVTFFGWIADAGIRLGNNTNLGFSVTKPFQNTVGTINNPLLYGFTISGWFK
jgi:hypothetical protein